jgi:molybdopterin converting factor small subunit
MDVRVTLYGPLRGVTGTKTVEVSLETDGTDQDGDPVLDAVVRAFVEQYPRSRDQLLSDEGEVRPSVRLLCDGERRELDDPVTGEVGLFPAMRGG